MVTSQAITEGQKKQFADVVSDAARKGAEEKLDQFENSGHLNSTNFQSVLAIGDRMKTQIADLVETLLRQIVTGVVGILKLISAGTPLVIPATDGTRTIAQANTSKKKMFAYLDSDFVNYGCDVPGEAKAATATEVYEMAEEGDFSKIFGSFGVNPDLLCLTQDQILAWIENHRSWLRIDGYATFFLFKVKKDEGKEERDEFFVAYVCVHAVGLRVVVYPFSRDFVWLGGLRLRIVVPQLVTPSEPITS